MAGFTLDDRYLREAGTVYVTGVQALVRVLFDRIRLDRRAGSSTAAFVSGYEGSPLGGFDLELARRAKLLGEHDVVHRPGVNEELGATSVLGSQLTGRLGTQHPDGVLGVWYGKAPGLDRASDALRHANLAGADPRGGAVALVGDDPNAKSSTVPAASEAALADLHIPTFFPADSQDVLDFGRHAVELSRASGLWSALKVVANVADSAGTATVTPDWTPPEMRAEAYSHRPSARLLGAELAGLESSLYNIRIPLALEYLRGSDVNRITRSTAGDRIGIVAAGKSYLDLRQALRTLGLDEQDLAHFGIRLLKLGAIHPLEPGIVREFAAGLTEIVVVEEKRSFLEQAIKEILYGSPDAPQVHGKKTPDGRTLFTELGELDPDRIARGLADRLTAHGEVPQVDAWRQRRRRERISVPLLARTPYFCSGCPHNSSTKVPDGTVVGAGIGCHTMALFMDPDQVGDVVGITQMGGEGTQWIGMAPFVGTEHFVQNIGDGTFTHSGSLAVRAAVAAGVNITYKLLHNSAVAMTGGQDAVGALPVGKIAELLLLEGVSKVIVTSDAPKRLRGLMPRGVTIRHRDELLAAQAELAEVPGVTVLIHDQECAAEKRRKRRRGKQPTPAEKVLINERVCEGCGDCGAKSNCLSVQPVGTEFGRKTQIHQSSCNVDYSCLAGDCPSFLTVVPSGRKQHREISELTASELPEPERGDDDFTVRITGVGGTGVVTVTQILATAAVIDGRQVRTLDQIGLAQKGGAVVSDLKITSAPVEQAPKLAAGECDLYLGCDLLVAADPVHLAAAAAERTTAVVSTTEVPTGRMVVDTEVSFPEQSGIRSALDDATSRAFYLDARGLAEELFDDDQFANILQLGAAYQCGALQLSAESIEQAIELNGTAVAANVQAFRRGRQAIADPDALRAEITPAPVEPPAPGPAAQRVRALVKADEGSELARLLDIRIPDLVDYQDEAYARDYAEFVEKVRRSSSDAVAEAVARNLYKLMAYKDEYEVARLSLDERLQADIEAQFGPGSRYAFRLHPPVLRALGMDRKISLGPWFRQVFRLLRAMRKVRGTRLDLFGYAKVRRVERELVEQYRGVVERAVAADHPALLELAELPDVIRGYEEIKLANVETYRAKQSELLKAPTPERVAAV
ncbi:indolepyruvate ferredoxin oxidoreductase family protein [Saccharopolyspora indica]|uniref:indolepyruvate ferredoxin oxidoreductase family protein n=1 Tax=Saccharopolyspora indica TaxID=1229659 RepID=UPI0022EA7CF3|nr:indolepyruvate ferredoxin oxidoreductase family protein [Saccharopolyspora indica]MDA3648962.1 indolepyruvate ferredoxin oxidoreductase family protein [Saccharopolyspora indica]